MVDRWLSLLGAITGLTALCFQLWHFVLSGARIKANVSQGISTRELQETGNIKYMMIISVSNHGRMPATVQHISVELSWEGKQIPLGDFNRDTAEGPNPPVRIEANSQAFWAISLTSLLALRENGHEVDTVRALVTMSDGRQIRSRGFLINSDATGSPLYSFAYLRYKKLLKSVKKKIKGRKASKRARNRWGIKN